MKAVLWHGDENLKVDTVDDPTIQEPTDAIVRIALRETTCWRRRVALRFGF